MQISNAIMKRIEAVKRISAPVTRKSHLYTDLSLDSFSFVRLLIEIETEYSIRFAITEMQECLQVDRLIYLTESKVKEKNDTEFIN